MTDQMKQLKLYISPDTKALLERNSKTQGLSVNQLVNRIISDWKESVITGYIVQQYRAGELIKKGDKE